MEKNEEIINENEKNINTNSESSIKKKIRKEYLIIFMTFFVLRFYLNICFNNSGESGIDGIGDALTRSLSIVIFYEIMIIIFCIINPIRILKNNKNEIKMISSRIKRYLYTFLIILPTIVFTLYLLKPIISEYIYNFKNPELKESYVVYSYDYRLPIEFEDELTARGLIFSKKDKSLLKQLNKKYEKDINKKTEGFYYKKGYVSPISDKTINDIMCEKEIDSYDKENKKPIYVYNGILTISNNKEKLHYVPISRLDTKNIYSFDKDFPYYDDYYIECKILYVDEDIYAFIGIGQSYNVDNAFYPHNKTEKNSEWTFPYNMIISEKDNITIFVDNRFYTNGAINFNGYRLEMVQSKEKADLNKILPIRKVDKLNIETINKIAEELQEGVLKNSIEEFLRNRADT